MLRWIFFSPSQTTGTLGAKGDCGADVSRWPLRIADRVGWNTGQELPPEDCAWDVQMMREQPLREPCSVENHKVENEKRSRHKHRRTFVFCEKGDF